MSVITVNLFKKLETVEPSLRDVLLAILEEIEKQQKERVTKDEFRELRDIVAELAQAQKRTEQRLNELAEAQKKTEQRLDSLTQKVNELAEAQKRTEQRVNELAEAQKKTEQRLDSLTQKVNELAEAQKRTEQRVNELAEAQKKTEERLDSLAQKVNELAEAQKRTEQRVNELAEAQKRTEQRVNELAEAQKKTEERLDSLAQKVNELAEAQKRTEQRVNELAEAQKRTEQRLNELAEAQKKTEEELKKLVSEHRKTREQLGGLSHTVGYVLEDRAYLALPQILNKDLGLEVREIKRDFIELSPNNYEELNIIGKGKKNGSVVWILGECKTQLKKKDVDSFLKKLSRVEHLFPGEKVLIMVTYQTSPQVKRYIQEKGIRLYFSYQLQNAILDLL